MKPRWITVAVLITLALPLFAQDSGTRDKKAENWSDYYYVNVPIDRIYPSSYGYVVQYRIQGHDLKKAYIPARWFTESAGKGSLIRVRGGATWPYMTVFYKDGTFDHLRLVVRSENWHTSWGVAPQRENSPELYDIEAPALDF